MNVISFSKEKKNKAVFLLMGLASALGLLLWSRRKKRRALEMQVRQNSDQDMDYLEFECWTREAR